MAIIIKHRKMFADEATIDDFPGRYEESERTYYEQFN